MTDDAVDVGKGEGAGLTGFLTYRMARTQARLNAHASRLLTAHGLTLTRWRVLALLAESPRVTAAQLARRAFIDKGLLSRALSALQNAGLVDRRGDGRGQSLDLTQAGRALYAEVLPHMRARQAKLRAELTQEEERHLLSALDKLERATGA